MGWGSWSPGAYDAAAAARRISGRSAFGYSDDTLNRPPDQWTVHPNLDPLGLKVREARDSDEHPSSTAIAVLFDVTGSMGTIPRTLQTKLPALLGLLLRKGYVPDPQILFGAIGDAFTDLLPLQFGQFESDNRLDECLGNIVLEGNGGGQMHESYGLGLYAVARHTVIDCFEKRGRRGYLFLIGDEMAYETIEPRQVEKLTGDKLGSKITLAQMLTEVKRRYEVFFLMAPSNNYPGHAEEIFTSWRRLLGERAVKLDEPDAVTEVIALAIGLCEGTADLSSGSTDLVEMGTSASIVRATTTALATVGATSTSLVQASGDLPNLGRKGGTTRI